MKFKFSFKVHSDLLASGTRYVTNMQGLVAVKVQYNTLGFLLECEDKPTWKYLHPSALITGWNNISIDGNNTKISLTANGTEYTLIDESTMYTIVYYSGFEYGRYILLNSNNPAYPKPMTSFTYITRVRQTSNDESAILGNDIDNYANGGLFLRTKYPDNTTLHAWGTYNSSDWDISEVNTGVIFTLNEWTWVKTHWDGSKYTWYQHADGTDTWTERNSLTSQACSAPVYTQLGNSGGGNFYWHGDYDISNTSIEVDGTTVFDGSNSSSYTIQGDLTQHTDYVYPDGRYPNIKTKDLVNYQSWLYLKDIEALKLDD